MKKMSSQVLVAIVCCILGFMVTYQFKMITRYNNNNNTSTVPNDSTDISVEVEQYKKEKDDLNKKINEMQNQLKSYENAAANQDQTTKAIVDELNNDRMIIGSVDVKGPGIVVYLSPKAGVFQNNQIDEPMKDDVLLSIVNELNSVDVEAISINDIRITSRTGIRNAGNYIYINDEKISPWSRITIKAIGDKAKMESILNFPGAIPDLQTWDVKIDRLDNITILKYNRTYNFNYAKTIK